MSEPDRPAPIDPSDWSAEEDPEATRVVRRGDQPVDEAATTQQVSDASDQGTEATGQDNVPESTLSPTDGDEPAGAAPTADADSEPAGSMGATGPQAEPSTPSETGGQPGASPWPDAPQGAETGSGAVADAGPPSGPTTGPTSGAPSGPMSAPAPGYQTDAPSGPGPAADGEPTSVVPPYGGGDPGATSYIGAPTAAYPGPQATGPQPYPGAPQGDYAYQQPPGYQQGPPGPAQGGPQFIAPPTASVALPPVRMPKAESRVAMNILGSIVGLILVIGGLVLVLEFQGKMRTVDTSDLDQVTSGGTVGSLAGSLDALSVVLTIVGVILIALAALLAAWASWAAILPGFLVAAVSVWAMLTSGPSSGGARIADATKWAFDQGQFAAFCMSGMGLLVGLLLLFAGLAAVFLRAGVRRTIRQQLESIQS